MQSSVAVALLALAFGAASAPAQEVPAAPASQTAQKPAQKPAEKPKKVWTNDDLAELRSTVQVTTAAAAPSAEAAPPGEAGAAAGAPAPGKEKELPPEKTAKYYKEKLEPLRKELAQCEAKIKEIQNALNDPSNGTNKINFNQSAPPGPPSTPQSSPPRPDNSIFGDQIVRPQDQLTYYQNRRDELQKEIDDLEAQAISNGLSRGDIQ